MDSYLPWRDLVRIGDRDGPLGLVVGASHHGHELYVPGVGPEMVPFSVPLLGYDRLWSALRDGPVAHARDCYGLERTALRKPTTAHFAPGFRTEWTRTLDACLASHYLLAHRQVIERRRPIPRLRAGQRSTEN